MDFCFIYITTASHQEATTIATALVEKKLIACANIYENVTSIYSWKGKIAKEKEVILIGKTTQNKYALIQKEVETLHSYDIPCIIQIPVEVNTTYATWLQENIA